MKIPDLFVKRPVFTTMLILMPLVCGIMAYFRMGVDLFPKIDLPTITVTVINPGASPQEIETEITDKVEGAVNTVSGIDELRSTSVEGASGTNVLSVERASANAILVASRAAISSTFQLTRSRCSPSDTSSG